MGISRLACLAAFASMPIAFALQVTPAPGETTRVSQSICKSIGEEHCRVDALKREISIEKRYLKGKKNARAVANLIGRPICHRIVDKFTYSPVRPLLRGWRMTLKAGGRGTLYACKL
ncbi:MAG: hypothetical protein ACJ8AS_03240 [Hyphomicrobiales bacterium]